MLTDDAVPTVFSFCPSTKRRKLGEARASKTEHCAIIEELLPGSSSLKKPSTENTDVQHGEN